MGSIQQKGPSEFFVSSVTERLLSSSYNHKDPPPMSFNQYKSVQLLFLVSDLFELSMTQIAIATVTVMEKGLDLM